MSMIVAFQPEASTGEAASRRSRLALALHRLGHLLEQAAIHRQRRRLIAETKRELRALDERTLRDIGLTRGQIDEFSESLLNPGNSDRPRRPGR